MKSYTNKFDKNNYNTHVSQYIKKERQSRNEIWSVNKS